MGDPRNCPTCRQTGATWCPHQPAPEPAAQPCLMPRQPRPSTHAGQTEPWTPAQTSQALKVLFCVGLGAGVWWLIRHSDEKRDAQEADGLEADAPGSDAGDYQPWEPAV